MLFRNFLRGLLAVCFMVAAMVVHGQDLIHKTDGELLKVRIISISANEIKYKRFDHADGPLYIVENKEVSKIVFEDGTEQMPPFEIFTREEAPEPPSVDISLYSRRAFKTSPFAHWIGGHYVLAYEQPIATGFNLEGSVGISNPNWNHNRRTTGGFVKLGIKYIPSVRGVFGNSRRTPPLTGPYVKLEAGYVNVSYHELSPVPWSKGDSHSVYRTGDVNNQVLALSTLLGYQVVPFKHLVIDVSFGAGISHRTYEADSEDFDPNGEYVDRGIGYFVDDSWPVILAGGVMIGYAF